MYTAVIVPLDAYPDAERAIALGEAIASRCHAPLRLVSAIRDWELEDRTGYLKELAAGRQVDTTIDVLNSGREPAEELADLAIHQPGALFCMSSYGRGRTGTMLGSVAEGLLRRAWGPVVLVGPRCERFDLPVGGAILAAIDGSPGSDEVVALAGSWAVTFGLDPSVVTNLAGDATPPGDTSDSAGVHRLATALQARIGREVNWEVLHGRPDAAAIADYAKVVGAAAIVMGTHGTAGLARLAVGSVTAATVHRAPCPVLVHRTLR